MFKEQHVSSRQIFTEDFHKMNIGRNTCQKKTSVTNVQHILTFTKMENQKQFFMAQSLKS